MPTACTALVAIAHAIAIANVAFNGVSELPLSLVHQGDQATLNLTVSCGSPVNGTAGLRTRAYSVDPLGGHVAAVALSNSTKTYFTISQSGHGMSDGFWLSQSVQSPGGAPLDQRSLSLDLEVSYKSGSVPSLDIAQDVGLYAYLH